MRGPELSLDSITSSVTGLPDGRVFSVMLDRKIALARRTLKPISIIFFELDEFESFAPYVREHAMRSASRVIINTVRESDTVCDLGSGALVALPTPLLSRRRGRRAPLAQPTPPQPH